MHGCYLASNPECLSMCNNNPADFLLRSLDPCCAIQDKCHQTCEQYIEED